eukprot:TRINITY_DN10200_c0_g1_i1.p1 TRINITY_DN10200_c0_g1~~TRINITY_DN10200_c0_g1_i1.p1  ORF type:complete len:244 (-),score=53.38 TRINITY_DN10200_c0_g1_i1:31-762(-)
MSLIYSCVANNSGILAEHSKKSGAAAKVVSRILEDIDYVEDGKMSYSYDSYCYHYWAAGGNIFLCMADEEFGKRIPFAFLNDIKQRWRASYGDRGRNAIPHQMQADFGRVLQRQMDYFVDDVSSDKFKQIDKQLNDTKVVLLNNIEKVIERGERIENLVDKTEHLSTTSLSFKNKSRDLERAMWWKNAKLMIMISAIVIILLYIVIAVACKGPTLPGCIKHGKGPSPSPPTSSPITGGTAGFF